MRLHLLDVRAGEAMRHVASSDGVYLQMDINISVYIYLYISRGRGVLFAYVLIPHPEYVRMRSTIRIVKLRLGHRSRPILVGQRNGALMRDADFVRSVAHHRAVSLVQGCQMVWLAERGVLVYLP